MARPLRGPLLFPLTRRKIVIQIRVAWAVVVGLVMLMLIGSVALLYGEDRPTFVTPKTGDPLYVLDRWFVSDLRDDGDELVLVLNLATYGKPKRPIRALGLVFTDKDKALVPFKNLIRALEGLKPRE